MWQDVVDNSLNAAFEDLRFSPLEQEELSEICIEISILSKPVKLYFIDEKDLLKKIDTKMGLILKFEGRQATFLPQVWVDLPDKLEFLKHLAKKAGLQKNDWKKAEFFYYLIEKETEKLLF